MTVTAGSQELLSSVLCVLDRNHDSYSSPEEQIGNLKELLRAVVFALGATSCEDYPNCVCRDHSKEYYKAEQAEG